MKWRTEGYDKGWEDGRNAVKELLELSEAAHKEKVSQLRRQIDDLNARWKERDHTDRQVAFSQRPDLDIDELNELARWLSEGKPRSFTVASYYNEYPDQFEARFKQEWEAGYAEGAKQPQPVRTEDQKKADAEYDAWVSAHTPNGWDATAQVISNSHLDTTTPEGLSSEHALFWQQGYKAGLKAGEQKGYDRGYQAATAYFEAREEESR